MGRVPLGARRFDSVDVQRLRSTHLPVGQNEVLRYPVVLLGGAGYIGSVAVAMLLEAGHSVNVLDDLSTGHADSLPPDVKLVKG
ncbi:MAG: NAD-dependent epimerase/dehydratase family protein, partial [Candidatus Nanopelagicaceae bacterium]